MSSKKDSRNTFHQEKLLLNPFDVNDDQMLEKIYMTHDHCVEKYDARSLYCIASNVVNHSIEIADLITENGQQFEQDREDNDPLISFPRLPTLKRISYQMICTGRGEQYAHQTTKLILEQLREYAWDAKAVIALAAFALEYGKFWQLAAIPRDKLGKSLAELNGLHSIVENIQHLANFNNLVKKVMQVVRCIIDCKKLITARYNIKDVPSLTNALHEIPLLAYWTIITLVSCTSHIDFLGDKGYKYDLSKFDYKLDYILKNFKEHQEKCNTQTGRIEDYSKRKDLINNSTETDIVKYLEALIIPTDPQDPRPVVYNVLTQKEVGIGVFKNKYVLMFISGTDNIEYETQLLISINGKLREGPKEGYRKEDFSILWIPIVSVWDEEQRKKVENITEVGWYVVKEFNFQTGIDLIKEVFNYKGNPIILLISPEGKVENPDAKQIISTWGIEGFPFRTSDHTRLTQQWNWFWTEMKNLSSTIRELINRDCYIFIYGGTDTKWIKDFSTAVKKLKNSGTFNLLETTIESYKLGSESTKNVPRFWITIDNMLASRKRINEGGEEVVDSITMEIKNFLALKRDSNGWAILTKGSHVKVLGLGEAMLRTVMDFEIWKGKLDNEVSFDAAFKDYYEKYEGKNVPINCEHRESANYPTDILAHLPPCPRKCGDEMEVASLKHSYKIRKELDYNLKNFKEHQEKCNTQIGRIEDYSKRKDIINNSTKTDIAKYFEALIIPSNPHDPKPIVYDVLTKEKVGIGVFKNKYVLLFISGTDNIEYETQLLISIDGKLREEPKDVEGYRKEDFSILWIPIVSVWDEEQRKKVENITEVGWYVVKEFNFQTGIDLIKEVFNYKGNPIILLISPEGKVENPDAKQIISTWGIEGFPFRTSDHTRLTQQWNWFWTEMKNLSSTIRELVNKDCYIFIYGGTNTKWVKDFSTAMEKLKNNGIFNLLETTIESYQFGKEGPKNIPRFWITIDNMLASRKRTKGGEEVEDSTTREIKNLLSLKQDPNGWAILTKGSHVKLLGLGEAMLRTVMDFEIWKEKLDHEVSFDVAFKKYYGKGEGKSVATNCEHREIANYPTDNLDHLPCPNRCGDEKEVAPVKHGYKIRKKIVKPERKQRKKY